MFENERDWSRTKEETALRRLKYYHRACADIVMAEGRELLPFVTLRELMAGMRSLHDIRVSLDQLRSDREDPRFLIGTTLLVNDRTAPYLQAALAILKRGEMVSVETLAEEMGRLPANVEAWIDQTPDNDAVLKRLGLWQSRHGNARFFEDWKQLYLAAAQAVRGERKEVNAATVSDWARKWNKSQADVDSVRTESFFQELNKVDPAAVEAVGYVFGKASGGL